MGDLITAIGLVLVIEGLLWAGAPGAAKSMVQQMAELPENRLRLVGIGAIVVGVVIVWLVRG